MGQITQLEFNGFRERDKRERDRQKINRKRESERDRERKRGLKIIDYSELPMKIVEPTRPVTIVLETV